MRSFLMYEDVVNKAHNADRTFLWFYFKLSHPEKSPSTHPWAYGTRLVTWRGVGQ